MLKKTGILSHNKTPEKHKNTLKLAPEKGAEATLAHFWSRGQPIQVNGVVPKTLKKAALPRRSDVNEDGRDNDLMIVTHLSTIKAVNDELGT